MSNKNMIAISLDIAIFVAIAYAVSYANSATENAIGYAKLAFNIAVLAYILKMAVLYKDYNKITAFIIDSKGEIETVNTYSMVNILTDLLYGNALVDTYAPKSQIAIRRSVIFVSQDYNMVFSWEILSQRNAVAAIAKEKDPKKRSVLSKANDRVTLILAERERAISCQGI